MLLSSLRFARVIVGRHPVSRLTAAAAVSTRWTAGTGGSNIQVASFSTEELVLGKGRMKTSTGLVGLAVDHEAIPKMIKGYQALLDTMAQSDMPETYHYRVVVEKMCRYRIQACLDHPEDPEMVEELCNCGQVEELVEQAHDEMEVLQMILDKRWWERIDPDIQVETNPDPINESNNAPWEEPPTEDLKRKE